MIIIFTRDEEDKDRILFELDECSGNKTPSKFSSPSKSPSKPKIEKVFF